MLSTKTRNITIAIVASAGLAAAIAPLTPGRAPRKTSPVATRKAPRD